MVKRPVTLTDILDGHAVLDISCLDRIYLNGYVPRLQTSGQVVGFLHHLSGDKYVGPIRLCDLGGPFKVAKIWRSSCQISRPAMCGRQF